MPRAMLRPLLSWPQRCALALALLAYGVGLAGAQVLPTGGKVVAGQVSIGQPAGNSLVIQQNSARGIVDWTSFSIGAGQSVVFKQPDASAAILNRVTGAGVSELRGLLQANGQVFLVNPAGILFGSTSSINVGAFIGSTLSLSNDDFLASRFAFQNAGGAGGIVNQGSLTASGGGIALIAPRVDNQGNIVADQGGVALAAGDKVTLNLAPDLPLSVRVDAATVGARIANSGLIQANGGSVQLSARASGDLLASVIDQSGTVRANSMSLRRGKIVLDGGPQGQVAVRGRIEARGAGEREQGGAIEVLGRDLLVSGTARLVASGAAGGGSVLVGGNFRGAGPQPNAFSTTVEAGATLDASATVNGNGGTVVVFADDTTRYRGAIAVNGGPAGGDGGRAEVSGLRVLEYEGGFTGDAPLGKRGALLIDPDFLCVGVTNVVALPILCGNAYSGFATSSINNNQTIDVEARVAIRFGADVSLANREAGSGMLTFRAPYVSMSARDVPYKLDTTGGDVTFQSTAPAPLPSSTLYGIELNRIDLGTGTLTVDVAAIPTCPSGASCVNAIQTAPIEAAGKVTTAGLIKRGDGVLELNQANDYKGSTQIEAGSILVRTDSALPAATVVELGNAGTLKLNAYPSIRGLTGGVGSTFDAAGFELTLNNVAGGPDPVFSGRATAGNLALRGSGRMRFDNVEVNQLGLTIDGPDVIFSMQPVSSVNRSLRLQLNAGSLDLDGSTLKYRTFTQNGGTVTNGVLDTGWANALVNSGWLDAQLTGSGALVKSGSGAVILSQAGDNTGVNSMSGGSLEFRDAGRLANLSVGSGEVRLNDNTGNDVALSMAAGTRLTAVAGVSNLSGPVTLSTSDLRVAGSAELTLGNLTRNEEAPGVRPLQAVGTSGGTGGRLNLTSGTDVQLAGVDLSDLSVRTSGAITQSAPLKVGGTASFLTGTTGGTVTLADAANQLPGPVNLSGSVVELRTAGDLTLGDVASGTGLLATAGGSIFQAAGTAVVVDGVARFTANGGDISLTGSGNTVTNILGFTSTGSVQFANLGNVVLGNIDVGGNLTLSSPVPANSAQSLSQSAGTRARVAGATSLTAGGAGSIALTAANNALAGPISARAGTIALTNGVTTRLGALTASGAVRVTTDGSAVSQEPNTAITATGLTVNTGATPAAASGDITLANAANQVSGSVSLTGHDLSLANAGGIALDQLAASGSLRLDAVAGDITQGASAITVAGGSTLSALAGQVDLPRDNTLTGTVELAAMGATVTAANDLQLGSGTITGPLAIRSTTGAIRQSAPLTVTGTASFSAPATSAGAIALTRDNDFQGVVSASGGPLAVTSRALQIDASTPGSATLTSSAGALVANLDAGEAMLHAATALTVSGTVTDALATRSDLGSTTLGSATRATGLSAGTLAVQAQGNVQQQGGALMVAGDSDIALTGRTGNVSLGSVANALGGTVRIAASDPDWLGDIALRSTSAATLPDLPQTVRNLTLHLDGTGYLQSGNLHVIRDFSLTTGDAVLQAIGATLRVDGVTTVDAGSKLVNLVNVNNALAGTVHLTAGDARLRNWGNVELGTVRSGALSVTAIAANGQPGTITQAPGSTIEVSGGASFQGQDLTLTASGNRFGGGVTLIGGSTALSAAGGLALDVAGVSDLTLLANRGGGTPGAVSLNEVQVTGNLDIASNGGAIVETGTPRSFVQVGGTTTLDARGPAIVAPATGPRLLGDIVLDAAANRLQGTVVVKGGDVTLVDAGALTLGSAETGGKLDVTADGDLRFVAVGGAPQAQVGGVLLATSATGGISQDRVAAGRLGVVVNNAGSMPSQLNAAGAVSLAESGNSFAGVLALQAGGSASIAGSGGLVFDGVAASAFSAEAFSGELRLAGDVRVTGDLNLQADALGAGITQLAGATSEVGGASTITAGRGSATQAAGVIELADLHNVFTGPVSLSGGATRFSNAAPTDMQTTLDTRGPTVLQVQGSAAAFNVAGRVANRTNASGAVVERGSLSVSSLDSPVVLGTLTVADNLALAANGANAAIGQSGALRVGGTTSVSSSAGAAVALANAGNDLAGLVTLGTSTGDISLVNRHDGTGVALGGTVRNLDLDLTSAAVALPAMTVTGNLAVQLGGGDLTQTGPVTVQGNASLSGNTLTLTDAANDFQGSVSLSAFGDARLRAANALSLGNLAVRDLDVASRDVLDVGSGTMRNLSAQSIAGAIVQTGGTGLQVSGTSTLAAASVVLDHPDNSLAGRVTLDAGSARVVSDRLRFDRINAGNLDVAASAGDLDLGSGSIGGTLTASATGRVTQNLTPGAAGLAIGLTSRIDAGGDIVLTNAANEIHAQTNLSGRNISLVNGAPGVPLQLGTVTARGDLSVATQDILYTGSSGPVVVAGTTLLDTHGQFLALTNSGNDFQGLVSASGGTVNLVDRNGIRFDSLAATGNLSVVANTAGGSGAVDLGVVSAARDLSVQAGAGAVSAALVSANNVNVSAAAVEMGARLNDVRGTVTLTGGDVNLANRGALTLGVLGNVASLNATAWAGDLDLGSGSISGALTARSVTGSIGQGGALAVGGVASLQVPGAGAITLDQAGNRFTGSVTLLGGNAATLVSQSALADLTLATSGPTRVQTTGAGNGITVQGSVTDTAGTPGDLSLASAGPTRLGALRVAGNVDLGSAGAVSQSGALSVPGRLAVHATASDVDVALASQANSVAGEITVDAAAGANLRDLALRNVDAGARFILPATVTRDLTLIANAADLSLEARSVGGNLSLQAGGSLGQTGPVSVAGATSLSAPLIEFTAAGNRFMGPVSLSGSEGRLAGAGDLALGSLSLDSLEVAAGGALVLGGGTVGTSLVARSSDRPLSQSGALTVNGSASFDAGSGSISLANAGNRFAGPVQLQGGATSLTNARDLDASLTTSGPTRLEVTGSAPAALSVAGQSGGDLTLVSNGSVGFGDLAVGGSLDASAKVVITQTGTLEVAGATALHATGRNVDLALGSAPNVLAGVLSVDAAAGASLRDVSLRNTDPAARFTVVAPARNLRLVADQGSLDLGGNAVFGGVTDGLILSAGDSVTQSVALRVPGTTSISAPRIVLDDAGNDFIGAVALAGAGAASLRDAGALTFGLLDLASLTATAAGPLNLGSGKVSGDLSGASAGNAITQAGALAIGGATRLDAGAAAITLSQTGNTFGGAVQLTGTDLRIANSADLNIAAALGGGATGGTLTVNAAGNATLGSIASGLALDATAGATLGQNQALVLDGPVRVKAATVILDATGNDFRNRVDLAGGRVTLADSNDLTLGSLAVTSLDVRSGGDLNLGAGAITETLAASSAAAAVRQSGALRVGGTSQIDAGSGAVSLSQAGNALTGAVTLRGGDVAVVNGGSLNLSLDAGRSAQATVVGSRDSKLTLAGTVSNDLIAISAGAATLGATEVGRSLTLVTQGSVDQTGVLQVTGNTAVQAVGTLSQAAGVALASQANQLGTVQVTGSNLGDVALRSGRADARFDVQAPVRDLSIVAGQADLAIGGNLRFAGLSRNLSLSASGDITQSQALSVPGTASFTGRNFVLTDAANDFTGAVSLNGTTATLVDRSALTLGTLDLTRLDVSAAGQLDLGAGSVSAGVAARGQGVRQSGGLRVGGTLVVAAGSGDVQLDATGNGFAGRVDASGAAVRIVNARSLEARVSATDDLDLETTSGALTVSGSAGGAGRLAAAGATSLGALTVAGGLELSSGGAISQSGLLELGGALALHATGRLVDVALDGQANVLPGPITVDATPAGSLGRVAIRSISPQAVLALNAPVSTLGVAFDQAPIDLPALDLTGDLNLVSTLGIAQSGAWNVGGAASFDAGSQALTLASAGNRFSGPVSVRAGATTLTSATPLQVSLASGATQLDVTGSLSASGGVQGDLTARASAAVSLDALRVSGALDLTGRDAITQSGLLTVGTGTVLRAAGGATRIALADAANDLGATVSVQAGSGASLTDVALRNTNTQASFAIGAATRDLTLIADRAPLDLAAQTVAGNLALQAGGAITQSGAWDVTGTTRLDAGGGAVMAGAATNRFGGQVTVRGASAELASAGVLQATLDVDAGARLTAGGDLTTAGRAGGALDASAGGAVSLGALGVGGSLRLSGASITQNGALSVAGASVLATTRGGVSLDNAANAFAGPVVAQAPGSVALRATGDLQLALDAGAAGRVTAGGELAVEARAGTLALVSGGATRLGASTVAGDLAVQAGSGLSQSAPLTVAGASQLAAGSGALVLDSATNALTGPVTASGASIALSNSLNLDARVSATGAVQLQGAGDLRVRGEAGSLQATGQGPVQFGATTVAGSLEATSRLAGISTVPGSAARASAITLNAAPDAWVGAPGAPGTGAFLADRVMVASARVGFLETNGGPLPVLGQGPAVLCLLLDGMGCVFTAPALQQVQASHARLGPHVPWLVNEAAAALYARPLVPPPRIGTALAQPDQVERCEQAALVEVLGTQRFNLLAGCN